MNEPPKLPARAKWKRRRKGEGEKKWMAWKKRREKKSGVSRRSERRAERDHEKEKRRRIVFLSLWTRRRGGGRRKKKKNKIKERGVEKIENGREEEVNEFVPFRSIDN